jgi:hypothetical protein
MAEEDDNLPEFEFSALNQDEDTQALLKTLSVSKNAYLFAVDCRPAMFVPKSAGGKTPFALAMGFVAHFMRNMVRTETSDLVGVLYYGTSKLKNANQFSNVYEHLPLDRVSAERITTVLRLESGKDAEFVESEVGHMDDAQALAAGTGVPEVLWYSSFAFQAAKMKTHDTKCVWFVSNDQDPSGGSADARARAFSHAKDFGRSAGRELFVYPVASKDAFSVKLYWQDLIQAFCDGMAQGVKEKNPAAHDQEQQRAGDYVYHVSSDADFEDIVKLARKKEFARRRLSSLPLHLGHGVDVACNLYATVLEAKVCELELLVVGRVHARGTLSVDSWLPRCNWSRPRKQS